MLDLKTGLEGKIVPVEKLKSGNVEDVGPQSSPRNSTR